MKANKPVFPSKVNTTVFQGLTARDYIAIQAMTGLSSNPGFTKQSYEEIADMAYRQADAMIKRSEVKDE